MRADDFVDVLNNGLREIEGLLRKYGHDLHADRAVEARDLLERLGGEETSRHLATLGWWGGAGSMADMFLYDDARVSKAEQNADNRTFRTALIAVYDAMKANGVTMPRAEFWTDAFREWERSGIYSRRE